MKTHGELFAGIGGFGLGADSAGMQTIWHVEIDKSAQSVLRRHWPNAQLESDVCEVGAHNLPHVDVISFGSPCQDLSIAGKRKGLENGTRSSLFFEAIRIVRELNPEVAIWENVPGALSSNGGQDFRAVLSEMLRADVPMPRSGRWATAGMVRSGEVEVAWRILDAQYFGVAQRRRRVFVVASFGNGRAAEILFEPESLSGNTPPSRETREGIADTFTIRSGSEGGGVTPSIVSNGDAHSGFRDEKGLVVEQPQYLSFARQRTDEYKESEIVSTISQRDYKSATDLILDDQGGSQMSISKDVVPTLGASVHGHQPLIVSQGGDKTNSLTASYGEGGADYETKPFVWEMQHASEAYRETQGGIATSVQSRMGTGGNQVPMVGIRRLTPTECARLQGFPDDWNTWGINDKGEKVMQSDSAMYKQYGNAVAVPVAEWFIERIVNVNR